MKIKKRTLVNLGRFALDLEVVIEDFVLFFFAPQRERAIFLLKRKELAEIIKESSKYLRGQKTLRVGSHQTKRVKCCLKQQPIMNDTRRK